MIMTGVGAGAEAGVGAVAEEGARTGVRIRVKAGEGVRAGAGMRAGAGVRAGVVHLVLMLLAGSVSGSRVRLDSEGGYRGVVVELEEQISQDNCKVILANVKVSTRGVLKCLGE